MNLKAYFIEKPVVERRDGKVVRIIRAPMAVPYDPTIHPLLGQKFLYWRGDDGALLLVGNDAIHLEMVKSARAAGIAVPATPPLGAGNLFILVDGIQTEEQLRRYREKNPMAGLNPRIGQWSSMGYNVGTPRGLRPTLKAMISPDAIETNAAAEELDDAEREAKRKAEEADQERLDDPRFDDD